MGRWSMVVGAALLLVGCGGGDDGPGSQQPIGEASFAAVRSRVFPSCSGALCHDSAQAEHGGVVIRPEEAFADEVYANLVNAPVASVPGRPAPQVSVRVVPGDPEASFLYWKILGYDPNDVNEDVAGDPMPPTCSKPPCLDDSLIELVRAWIAAGAPRE